MPKNESFWNPYRWVRASDQPIQRASPNYHHQLTGLSGRIGCELRSLTPLLIGDGQREVAFVNHKTTTRRPFIPATSLKGAIRSLAELIGNAAVPSDKDGSDAAHAAGNAAQGAGSGLKLDVVARSFGYMEGRKDSRNQSSTVFAGLIRFSDAELIDDRPPQPLSFQVAGGQPKPTHRPFYPGRDRRKLYHHQYSLNSLTPPHANIKEGQKRTVRPLPPETGFHFTVDFLNLRDEELNLLLYCLVLEEQVTVTLSPAALGPNALSPVTFFGPLRHKIGGCKSQGAGSCHLRITKLLLHADPAARYRGETTAAGNTWMETDLAEELMRRTEPFRQRTDATMNELRAMLIYSENDPRRPMNYPSFEWFKEAGSTTPLRPTL